MLSPSASPQPSALPQPTHPHPYSPPPPLNDPPSSVDYNLFMFISSLLPVLLFCCLACCKRLREHANQPQPQDIEQGIPRNPPQLQQQQQQAPREVVSGTVVKYTASHESIRIANCTECVICLEDFKEEEQCRVLDGCKHMYHKACIDKWLTRDKHCPLCRDSVRQGARSNHQNQV